MRLAHLILAHNNPRQLDRLVSRLCDSQADIYIQLDKKTDQEKFKFLASKYKVQFIENRVKIYWGNYSIVQATLNGFEEILNQYQTYTHINLLSGQDYPLKDASEIQAFFFDNPEKTFMHSLSIDKEWDEAKPRIYKYHFGDFMFPGRYRLQAVANFLLPARKIPENLVPYGRSQWFTISVQSAAYVINYLKENPKVRNYFRMTWAPDEFIFQTILYNSLYRYSVVNDNCRYIDFSLGGYHPKTLDVSDFDDLINSGKFYARKFDADVSIKLLDKLDNTVARYGDGNMRIIR